VAADTTQAARLLTTADAGGSNGYRTRAWKLELAQLAAETGLTITVCRLPPTTSKWNKIEHRLFSHITMSWRGRPLTSHEVIVRSIAATTTRTGLRVSAALDTDAYPTGVRIGDAETAALPLPRHAFHGDWSYALHPQPRPAVPVARAPQAPAPQWDQALGRTGPAWWWSTGCGGRLAWGGSRPPRHQAWPVAAARAGMSSS
jgi:hypothetical protein